MDWKGKRVLVTGAGGFIGSHLCERLVQLGAQVRAMVRYNSAGCHGLLELLPEETRDSLDVYPGDILDEPSTERAMQGIDLVFHMAAIPSIPFSLQNPRHVFSVNTWGSLNVLLAAKDSGVGKVILASSAGASEKRPILSPYIASKSAMERIGIGFAQGLDLPVSVMRLMNNFGPRQSARAVIPTIISQALSKDDVHLGATDPKQDFNYVGDSVEALLRTAMSDAAVGRALTWGTGITTSIGDVAETVFSLIGNDRLHIVQDTERIRPAGGPKASLQDDIMATREVLEFEPQTSLAEGLRMTIDWMAEHLDRYKTDVYAI